MENWTFEHMGMIATVIDGVVLFVDRSYARATGGVEYHARTTIEDSIENRELYGSVRVVRGLMAVACKGAKRRIQACSLNAKQLMILLMQCCTPRRVHLRGEELG